MGEGLDLKTETDEDPNPPDQATGVPAPDQPRWVTE